MKLLLSILLLLVCVGCGGTKEPSYARRMTGLKLLCSRVRITAVVSNVSEEGGYIVWES